MTATNDADLELSRTFDVPAKQLFAAWTRPEYLEKWLGPEGFQVSCEMDFREGGKLEIIMRNSELTDVLHGVYRKIVPDQKIVESFRFDDSPDLELVQTITFDDTADGKSVLSVHQSIPSWTRAPQFQRAKMLPRVEGGREGWTQTLEHLARFVTSLEDLGERDELAARSRGQRPE
jgi:uncharacterized protein YndB with AHSA1/START domain